MLLGTKLVVLLLLRLGACVRGYRSGQVLMCESEQQTWLLTVRYAGFMV